MAKMAQALKKGLDAVEVQAFARRSLTIEEKKYIKRENWACFYRRSALKIYQQIQGRETMELNSFVKRLKAMEAVASAESLAEMVTFAADQASQNNFNPLDALYSASLRAGLRGRLGLLLASANVWHYAKAEQLAEENHREWRGIAITHVVRAKRTAKDHETNAPLTVAQTKEALRLCFVGITKETLLKALAKAEAEAEAAKAEAKAKATAEAKTKEYWKKKAEKLAAAAAKAGFNIQFQIG
jgi:hypothetical protein